MKTIRNIFLTCVFILCWQAFCLAGTLLSDESVIDDINVSKKTGKIVITIHLTYPMRYVSNIPLERGDEVFVRLAPLSSGVIADCVKFNRESRTVPFAKIKVQYTGSNIGGPYLQVIFPEQFTFRVLQGRDYRSIHVELLLPEERTESPEQFDILKDEADEILRRAVEKETGGELGRAIQLYTKLTERAVSSEIREIAQERLADARAVNQQLAHARAEYKRFLELYPTGKSVERVQRKLDAITGGGDLSDLQSMSSDRSWRHDFYGDISQFVEQEGRKIENEGFEQDISLLDTDVAFRLRAENSKYEIRGVADGGYELSLLDDGDDRGRMQSLYFEGAAKASGFRGRLGRSYSNKGGVWGRFDGGDFSIPFGSNYRLNVIGGFPVNSSYDKMDTETFFYGVNLDYRLLGDKWELNTFYLHQEADGFTDRQGIGGEVRFINQMTTCLFLADYDLYHRALSLALFNTTLNIDTSTTLSVSWEYRKSPFLATSNALIGQQLYDLDDLYERYSEDEIKQIAKDRSADSSSAHLGLYHILTETLQIGFDVTWSQLGGTDPSAGVESFGGTDDELYYLLQITDEGLFYSNDIWTAKLKYSDTTNYDVYGAQLYSRFRFGKDLLLVPEFNVEYREHKEENLEKIETGPELRIEYALTKNITVELECGYLWLLREDTEADEQSEEYFIYFGYYWSF